MSTEYSVKTTMAMRAPVAKKKVVSRFFYQGKGYANRGVLYRTLAKKMLVDMVMKSSRDRAGDIPELDRIDGDTPNYSAVKRAAMDELFSRHFQHSDNCHKIEGGCRVEWVPGMQGDDFYEQHVHVYKSCRVAQKLWISNKANELRAYDDSLATKEPGETP